MDVHVDREACKQALSHHSLKCMVGNKAQALYAHAVNQAQIAMLVYAAKVLFMCSV